MSGAGSAVYSATPVRHCPNRLGEEILQGSPVLRAERSQQLLERGLMASAKLVRGDAACEVVARERTAGPQMEHADVALAEAGVFGHL